MLIRNIFLDSNMYRYLSVILVKIIIKKHT